MDAVVFWFDELFVVWDEFELFVVEFVVLDVDELLWFVVLFVLFEVWFVEFVEVEFVEFVEVWLVEFAFVVFVVEIDWFRTHFLLISKT